jgi:hypothetical protein
MPPERITRDDIASAVGARRELGEELEPAVVDAFLERVERAIDAQVDAKLAESKQRRRSSGGMDAGQRLALSIVSLGTGIPITAIAAEQSGTTGILIVWLGIVGVNVAQRFSRD